MATVKYVWKGGAGIKEESTAQIVGERLAQIEQENGALKAEFVVSDARSDNSPLHRFFEWDDTKAADQHRLWQARSLITHIHVKTIDQHEVKSPTRAFVNLKPEPEAERTYENIVSVMSDEMKRKRLLARAREEFNMWRNRYQNLDELADVFKAFERVAA